MLIVVRKEEQSTWRKILEAQERSTRGIQLTLYTTPDKVLLYSDVKGITRNPPPDPQIRVLILRKINIGPEDPSAEINATRVP